ncbi:DMT family transporter [Henriciella aquimarina]|uniref:DMT family transporter n=1 Tax=Henriciella aquimarina TaxID=545261 RepID=UPI0009FCC186|nr:DMT family transporter [Henriciella aquimarina]
MTETELHLPPARAWVGPLLLLAGGVMIGLAPIGLRYGLDALGPQAIAFWRYLFAIPLLFILLVGIEQRLPRQINRYVVMAGTFFALDIGLWHWGLTLTTVANATFIVNLGNICVGFVAWLFLKEKPKPIWFIAVLVAVAGAAALSLGGEAGGKTDIRGDLMALGAACLVAAYMLCSKLARNRLGAMDVIFWLTVVEAGVAALLVLVSGEAFLPATLSGFAAPAFLALAAQVGGQGLIIAGLGRTPAAVAGIVVLIQPVVAAAISWQLFDEPLTAIQGSGAALILFGIWLSQGGIRRKRPKTEAKPLQEAVKSPS